MSQLGGNHFSTFGHHPQNTGSGVGRQASPFGRITMSGGVGEIRRISLDGAGTNVCQYQAILVQALGGDVTVEQTLVDAGLACNPDNDATVWAAPDTVLAGTITTLAAPVATALKITFTEAATVIIAVT